MRALQRCDVSAAAEEGYRLHRAGHAGALRLRRLVLSTGSRSRSAPGVRKRRPSRAASRLTPSVGAIFGATLKSVLDYSGVPPRKRDLIDALQHMARFLAPTRDAVAGATGADRPHLANGLMSEFVATAQRRRLDECREPQGERTYLGRNNLGGVAVGATAAVLAAHHVMAVRGALGAEGVRASLADALARVDALLANWPIATDRDDAWHVQALRAEARAVARVRAVGVAAADAAAAQLLDGASALQLQLEWMRRAAWPRGAHVDATSHVRACEALARGEALGGAEPLMPPPLRAVPLAALPASVWISSAASEASSSSDGSRSEAGSIASSASSVGSEGGSEGVYEDVFGGEDAELALSVFGIG